MDRTFVGAHELLLDSYRLALRVFRSDFRPKFLIGLWPGGSAVGMAVQECLEHLGVATDHACVRIFDSGLETGSRRAAEPDDEAIRAIEDLTGGLGPADSLLIVDDVYSSGSRVAALLNPLGDRLGRAFLARVRVAALWYRPTPLTLRPPDYFEHETSDWIVLPHELAGLSIEEIYAHKPGMREILGGLRHIPEAAKLFGERPDR